MRLPKITEPKGNYYNKVYISTGSLQLFVLQGRYSLTKNRTHYYTQNNIK